MHPAAEMWVGYTCLTLFCLAYLLVILEDTLHLKKSKPVILFSCLMWLCIGVYQFTLHGDIPEAEFLSMRDQTHHFMVELVSEIGQLFFFLMVAMTYINTLSHLRVFDALQNFLVRVGLSYKMIFWVTGLCAFFISPFADNLTTALLMATVVHAVSKEKRFIVPSFINVVVAANAGGCWSPFGDITSLMVWTAHKVDTMQFLYLFFPALTNWFIPAFIMSFAIPKGKPKKTDDKIVMKPGAKTTMVLGVLTIAMTVCFHNLLHLPPFIGMMMGLGLLMFFAFLSKKIALRPSKEQFVSDHSDRPKDIETLDIFHKIQNVEFDTLFFFFGILMAVGALQFLGYLAILGNHLYGHFGNTWANIMIGLISAVGDNIPVMYAVIKMNPPMGVDQWLLATMTVGVGGSLLSIGSAAGVAVMGVNRTHYTFLAHLKWMPAVAAGFVGSILVWYVCTAPLHQ